MLLSKYKILVYGGTSMNWFKMDKNQNPSPSPIPETNPSSEYNYGLIIKGGVEWVVYGIGSLLYEIALFLWELTVAISDKIYNLYKESDLIEKKHMPQALLDFKEWLDDFKESTNNKLLELSGQEVLNKPYVSPGVESFRDLQNVQIGYKILLTDFLAG